MNVYIWTDQWSPWENTIAYYPFRDDILDHSWNNKNFTWTSWNYSFSNNTITISSDYLSWPLVTPEWTTWDRTISIWQIWPTAQNGGTFSFRQGSSWTDWYLKGVDAENWNRPWAALKPGSTRYRNRPSSVSIWSSFLMTWTKTGTTMKLYLNGVLVSTTTLNTATWNYAYSQPTWTRLYRWTYWEIIIEDKVRTDVEILNYYNSAKSNYGL